ncbi:MAG: hypothetical protein ACE15E_15175 [Acidobacteriota bacterium]
MPGAPLYCTSCLSVLEVSVDLPRQQVACPNCAAELECWLLPALFRRPAAGSPARPAAPGQAACFNHAGRQAVVECKGCGRFLCGLCDIEVRGRHWCPSCLAAKRAEATLSPLPDSLTRYDRIALALTLLPMLFCCGPSLVTAPIALFIVIKHWNAPGSERASFRNIMLVSVILSVVQILFFIFWMYVVFVPPDYRGAMGV